MMSYRAIGQHSHTGAEEPRIALRTIADTHPGPRRMPRCLRALARPFILWRTCRHDRLLDAVPPLPEEHPARAAGDDETAVRARLLDLGVRL